VSVVEKMKNNQTVNIKFIKISLLVLFFGLISIFSVNSATIVIVNGDGANEGLNDNASFTPVGGNNATTLGQARINSFNHAAQLIANEIESDVVIEVLARFDPLTCSSGSATLGQAGARTGHSNFTNAPILNTVYPQALANSYVGFDLSVSFEDIQATFNSSLDTGCFALSWYYGFDGNNPSGTLDFTTTALHEIIHGLGFASRITSSGSFFSNTPGAYDRFLINDNLTQLDTATNSQRASAITSGDGLLWDGPSVGAIVSQKSNGTNTINNTEYIQMYAPSPYRSGSSTSHYDTAVSPNELMEPSLVVNGVNLEFSLALLEDIGWILTNNPPPPPPPPGGTGAFIETGGQVVMEAENFDENNTGSTDDWFLSTSQGGYSGTGYMESGVNNGTNINTGYAANSPELKYLVNFTTPGTYHVWTRTCGPGSGDDSIHMGIDGNESTTANRKTTGRPCSSFRWFKKRMSGASDATIVVPSSGEHEINLWMREDGSRVDKILLTTSSGFTPTGTGPAESNRDEDPPPPPPTPVTYTLNVSITGNGSVTSSPGGIDCESDCTEDYNEDTVVTLTATADSGSTFVQWNGDSDCSDGSVTMTSNKTCTAVFDELPPNIYTLNVQTNGGTGTGSVTSSPGGIDCESDCTEDYNEDTVVTLTAVADSGSTFVQWNGDSDCSDDSVTMTSNKTCTAVFDTEPPPPPPGGTGAFIEESGQVVMEAENFDENNTGSTDDWFLSTSQGGYSGTGYMESGVNNGTNINTGYAANSPELKYLVNFTTPGTYHVWTRTCGPGSGDDSIHMGIDGNESSTANRKKTGKPCSSFRWFKNRMSGASDATIVVPSSGEHEINLWMREDGSRVDKILLTQSSSFTPTGNGPDESNRE